MPFLKKWILSFRVIFLILGIVILVQIFMLVAALIQPALPPHPLNPQISNVGKIELTASKGEFQVGETVSVSVLVSTGGRITEGTDLVLHFDPNVFEATPEGILKGQIYPDYPSLQLDGKQGIVWISGVAAINKVGYSGTGIFATINFKAKRPGQTKISIEFQKGSTKDSNIIEAQVAEDILEEVSNLELEIK